MGSAYQSQSASGYNSSPPPDDGSTVAANKITWATIKSKITDPVKTLADAVNTALRTALNITPSTTSAPYTTTVSDHLTTVEVTGSTTISLGDAATMVAQSMGYAVTVYNKGTGTVTVNLATGTNKINGNTNGAVSLAPGQAMTFTVAQSGTDYEVRSATGFAPFVLTGAAGTNTATANAPANLIGLYTGLQVIWTPAATNTGALTLNITPSGGSALTAKNVFYNGAACSGGEATISVPYVLVYDGTQFNILGSAPAATQAQQETGSATNVFVTPGRQQFHPSAAKGWGKINVTGGADASYNVTSVTDNGTGDAFVVWNVDFSTSEHVTVATPFVAAAAQAIRVSSLAAGQDNLICFTTTTGTAVDPVCYLVTAFGDQP